MPKFHFVEDYEAHIKHLLATKPYDEAMRSAVGPPKSFEYTGDLQRSVLLYAGLKDEMKLIDYACGSGRLARSLGKNMKISYLGIDIVDELLKYSKENSPKEYSFLKHQGLDVPVESSSVDFICAFSLFTHLLHSESYIYIEDMHRALKKNGRLVFTFFEFEVLSHWKVFKSTVEKQKNNKLPVLNTFIEKSVIRKWAKMIDYNVIEFVEAGQKRFDGKSSGQSIAILEKK